MYLVNTAYLCCGLFERNLVLLKVFPELFTLLLLFLRFAGFVVQLLPYLGLLKLLNLPMFTFLSQLSCRLGRYSAVVTTLSTAV